MTRRQQRHIVPGLFLSLALLLGAIACSDSDSQDVASGSADVGTEGGDVGGSTGGGADGNGDVSMSPGETGGVIAIDGGGTGSSPIGVGDYGDGGGDDGGNDGIQSGTLTAGVWDDNLNFEFYSSYLSLHDQAQLAGRPEIFRQRRLVVQVADDDGAAVSGVRVVLFDGDIAMDATLTGADGRALFFPDATVTGPLTLRGTRDQWTDETTVDPDQGTADLVLPAAAVGPVTALDLALIIDTTGSMGDELRYLTVEINAIAAAIADALPGVDQRYGLVLYRDIGDAYVTRVFDFTSNLTTFQQNLAAQQASGGGDYPEALDQGLQAGVNLSWRTGRTARVAFLIADAPHHVGNDDNVVDAIYGARDKGIRLYPVSASGANVLTEYTMRTMAQVTGGRYLFLTDDSGIGDSHLEPTIPCYQVTRLDQAMVRVVKVEVTGTHIPVDPDHVIRTVGNPDPDTGRCVLQDETEIIPF